MRKPFCVFLFFVATSFFWLSSAEAEYRSKGKRDPFVPLLSADGERIYPPGADEETVGGFDGLNLQGIVFDHGSDSYAVINGRVVREQDDVDGMKVLKIEPTAVTIQTQGQSIRFNVRQPTEEEAAKQ